MFGKLGCFFKNIFGKSKKPDSVEVASDDSFPASDPPSWTETTVHTMNDE